ETIAPRFQRTHPDGGLPAGRDDLFHPQGFALEFGRGGVEVGHLDDNRLAGWRGRLSRREFVVLEGEIDCRRLVRRGQASADPEGDDEPKTGRENDAHGFHSWSSRRPWKRTRMAAAHQRRPSPVVVMMRPADQRIGGPRNAAEALPPEPLSSKGTATNRNDSNLESFQFDLRRPRPRGAVTALAGVYSGSPLPAGSDGSQLSNQSGVSFPLNGVLPIAELQYALNGGVDADKPDPNGAPPGTYKIGAWYDSESFDDQQYDDMGLPLAGPLSDGTPTTHHGNYSIYALADQMVWRTTDGVRNVSAFVRPMFTTLQDRNLVSFSINGGIAVHQPFAGRDKDTFRPRLRRCPGERRRRQFRPQHAALPAGRL